MFNDKYGLTEAVLNGKKVQTRRIATIQQLRTILQILPPDGRNIDELAEACRANSYALMKFAPYALGEVVAVAQSYSELAGANLLLRLCTPAQASKLLSGAGATNKMFVKSSLMPNRIIITNVRVERLRDISDEDCMKEGVKPSIYKGWWSAGGSSSFITIRRESARLAFADIIDMTCGTGTWDSNPWVFVYDFLKI